MTSFPRYSLHPRIDRRLNKNYHFNYSHVYMGLWQDHSIRHTIDCLHRISRPRMNALKVSASANTRNAAAVVSSSFVQQ